MEPGERVATGFLVGVGVNLQGRADPGMPENRLCVAGRHTQVLEK
jgi:hypothetical protein